MGNALVLMKKLSGKEKFPTVKELRVFLNGVPEDALVTFINDSQGWLIETQWGAQP